MVGGDERGGDTQEVGQLLKRFSDQARKLAQQEIELAKAELSVKAKSRPAWRPASSAEPDSSASWPCSP